MICELIMIAGMALNPCNIVALEPSTLQKDKCIAVTNTGRRYNFPMSCGKLYNSFPKHKPTESCSKMEFEI